MVPNKILEYFCVGYYNPQKQTNKVEATCNSKENKM